MTLDNETNRLQNAFIFVKRSFLRLFRSKTRRLFFIISFAITSFLFVFIVWGTFSRYARIGFAGGVFATCLVGSIFFGLPAALAVFIANVGGTVFTFRLFAQTSDWYYLSIAVFQITTTVSAVVIAIIADMERDEKHKHFEASLTDSLTELFNARYFYKRLSAEIERSARSGTEVSILCIDLDSFKNVNDNFGHDVGNLVLVETARIIMESVRTSDVACRQGGDEFVVVLPDTSLEVAENIGARMQATYPERLCEASTIPDGVVAGLSFGAATYPAVGDLESLVKQADTALYQNKRQRGTGRSI